MATGCLSAPQSPKIAGVESLNGELYYTSRWPRERVDLSGKRIGVIGAGPSAIQAIPVIAAEAGHLTVFQRTPNFSVPAVNAPHDPKFVEAFKANYAAHRENQRLGLGAGFGDLQVEPHDGAPELETAMGESEADVRAILEKYWRLGGTPISSATRSAQRLKSRRPPRLYARRLIQLRPNGSASTATTTRPTTGLM
jgi:cation diffusion facilitator CzcD-associated flavoprotein CzcO